MNELWDERVVSTDILESVYHAVGSEPRSGPRKLIERVKDYSINERDIALAMRELYLPDNPDWETEHNVEWD